MTAVRHKLYEYKILVQEMNEPTNKQPLYHYLGLHLPDGVLHGNTRT